MIRVIAGLVRVKPAYLDLGDTVGLHHEANHGVGEHLFEEVVFQRLATQFVLRDGVLQVSQGNGQCSR